MNNHSNPIFAPAYQAKAKAVMKKFLAYSDKPKVPKAPKPILFEIKSGLNFAAWAAQFPKEKKCLAVVTKIWRRSWAKVQGKAGYWAAWEYEKWTFHTRVSKATFKRYLDRLETAGLIEREVHRHGGTPTIAFIRPSPLAILLLADKPADWLHYGDAASAAETLEEGPNVNSLTVAKTFKLASA